MQIFLLSKRYYFRNADSLALPTLGNRRNYIGRPATIYNDIDIEVPSAKSTSQCFYFMLTLSLTLMIARLTPPRHYTESVMPDWPQRPLISAGEKPPAEGMLTSISADAAKLTPFRCHTLAAAAKMLR